MHCKCNFDSLSLIPWYMLKKRPENLTFLFLKASLKLTSNNRSIAKKMQFNYEVRKNDIHFYPE